MVWPEDYLVLNMSLRRSLIDTAIFFFFWIHYKADDLANGRRAPIFVKT